MVTVDHFPTFDMTKTRTEREREREREKENSETIRHDTEWSIPVILRKTKNSKWKKKTKKPTQKKYKEKL